LGNWVSIPAVQHQVGFRLGLNYQITKLPTYPITKLPGQAMLAESQRKIDSRRRWHQKLRSPKFGVDPFASTDGSL
jgi:hypothetical protein